MRATSPMHAIALAICLTFSAGRVAAQVAPAPPPRLGTTVGQILLTGETALDYQRDVASGAGAPSVTTTTYDLHIAFDRVVWPRLVVGGRFGFDGSLSGLDTRKAFDLGLRVGGLLPLGRSTIWWPSVGLGYGFTRVQDRSTTTSLRTVTLALSGAFVWQPARHLMIGVGPTYRHDLQVKTGPGADEVGPKTRGFGVHGLIGMWF